MEETEINEPIVPAEPKGVLLLEDAQYFLHAAGKWAKFLGIMGFIGAGLIALCGLFAGTILSAITAYQPTPFPAVLGVFLGFVYIVIGVIAFFVSLKLYQFGDNAKLGVEFKNAERITTALSKLKSFFKIKGVILICALSIYALFIVIAIVALIIGASVMRH